MDSDRSSRMHVLAERLRSIDKSISRLTAERLKVLAEIAKIDAEDGASERQTASRVARLTSSTPKQAAGEVAMAKQVAALPGVAEAFANGEISSGQLGAVAAIASASSEDEALALAKTATSSQLHQRAAASRGKLFEERCKAQKSRYLAFKPEEDGQSTRIHGRLPFAESKHLEMQLRKIADRLGLCDKERPSPSARMADALLILTKHNPSQALHDHEEEARQQAEQASTPPGTSSSESSQSAAPATGSTTRPKLYALTSLPGGSPKPVIDYDEDPFPETDANTAQFSDHSEEAEGEDAESENAEGEDFDGAGRDQPGKDLAWGESNSESPNGAHAKNNQRGNDLAWEESNSEDTDGVRAKNDQRANNPGRDRSSQETSRPVIVQRADTRLIIHWNAQNGGINFENGPPIDHPRLMALLCDAQIDIQHCDANGLPTGLISTAHHSTWRQDRYLAFRDGSCRIPECEGIGKTQAHHIFQDRIDRVTSVEYMINLCNRCHQEHHDGNFTINGKPEQTITFTYQSGITLTSTARPLPQSLKPPKSVPFSKHPGANLLAKSA
jgi:chorismate mutase